jgi:hypothetical protein
MFAAASAPTDPLDVAAIQQTAGPEAVDDVKLLVGQCESDEAAQHKYKKIVSNLPPAATATLFGRSLLVAIPDDNDDLRERLMTEMEASCKDPYVAQGEGLPWLRISCIAPSEEVAARIEEECNLYFSVPREAYLVPPWSPDGELGEDELKGRHTWRLLQGDTIFTEVPDYMNDPAYKEQSKQLSRAMRRGDSDALEKAQKQIEQIIAKHRREHLQRVKNEKPDVVRREVIELYETQPQMPQLNEEGPEEDLTAAYKRYQDELNAWHTRIGSLMGQLPLEEGRPMAQELQYCTQFGSCTRAGLLLTFQSLAFERADRAAPIFVKWLADQGCVGMKYAIDAGIGLDGIEGWEFEE